MRGMNNMGALGEGFWDTVNKTVAQAGGVAEKWLGTQKTGAPPPPTNITVQTTPTDWTKVILVAAGVGAAAYVAYRVIKKKR